MGEGVAIRGGSVLHPLEKGEGSSAGGGGGWGWDRDPGGRAPVRQAPLPCWDGTQVAGLPAPLL